MISMAMLCVAAGHGQMRIILALHAHGHNNIDRAGIIALAHQRWISRGIKHENCVLTINLAGDFEQVFGVKANFKHLIRIGHCKLFLGSAAGSGVYPGRLGAGGRPG